VGGDDRAHDRQAEAGAVPGPLLASPAERLQQAVDVRVGDLLAAVGDLQDRAVPFGAGADGDPAVRAVVLDRVADQVVSQLAEQRRVAVRARLVQSGTDGQALRAYRLGRRDHGLPRDLVKRHRLPLPGRDHPPGQGQQPLQHPLGAEYGTPQPGRGLTSLGW
jgi:hypothetical protein